jgi:hypothetical protein
MAAEQLREGSGRVVARVVGLPPERARVRVEHVRQDFHTDTVGTLALVDEFVAEGLLRPRAEREGDFFLTERFIEIAAARIVEPIPHARARILLDEAAKLAARINQEWRRNPYEIEAVAAFGSYMGPDDEIPEVDVGVVLRPRAPSRRTRWMRMAEKHVGAHEIRHAFREVSPAFHVQLLREMRQLPRPYALMFRDG